MLTYTFQRAIDIGGNTFRIGDKQHVFQAARYIEALDALVFAVGSESEAAEWNLVSVE